MTLKGYNSLWYAICAILWLNVSHTVSAMVPSERALALATFYRLLTVTMPPSAVVWLQFSIESFKL